MEIIPFLFIFFLFCDWLLKTQGQVTITLFEGPGETGYSHDYKTTEECSNVPAVISPLKGTVRTAGCVMVYEGQNCTDYSIKIVNESSNVNGYTWSSHYTRSPFPTEWPTFAVQSYHACSSKTDGGSQVNVDLLQYRSVVLSLENLCGCRNMPMALEDKIVSLNNHGNEVYVYQNEDCSGFYEVIPAGTNPQSENLYRSTWNANTRKSLRAKVEKRERISGEIMRWKARSFRPGNNTAYSQNCIRLSSSIYKFEFLKPEEDGVGRLVQVELAGRMEFMNRGPVVQASTYTVTKTVRETLEIEMAAELRGMHKVGVEASVSVETEAGIPLLGSSKVTASLTKSYEHSWESVSRERESVKVENERSVTMIQKIEVPSCTRYTASATMAFAKNKVVKYKAYSTVTGEMDGQKMSAQQIRDYINSELELLENWDEFTVVAVATGSVKVEYEVSSQISGQGERIPNCFDGVSNDLSGVGGLGSFTVAGSIVSWCLISTISFTLCVGP